MRRSCGSTTGEEAARSSLALQGAEIVDRSGPGASHVVTLAIDGQSSCFNVAAPQLNPRCRYSSTAGPGEVDELWGSSLGGGAPTCAAWLTTSTGCRGK